VSALSRWPGGEGADGRLRAEGATAPGSSKFYRLPLCIVKMKRSVKFESDFVFLYFSVTFVLFDKYSNHYENRIWCYRNQSKYGWAYIPFVF
jgi:hypothetical protein